MSGPDTWAIRTAIAGLGLAAAAAFIAVGMLGAGGVADPGREGDINELFSWAAVILGLLIALLPGGASPIESAATAGTHATSSGPSAEPTEKPAGMLAQARRGVKGALKNFAPRAKAAAVPTFVAACAAVATTLPHTGNFVHDVGVMAVSAGLTRLGLGYVAKPTEEALTKPGH